MRKERTVKDTVVDCYCDLCGEKESAMYEVLVKCYICNADICVNCSEEIPTGSDDDYVCNTCHKKHKDLFDTVESNIQKLHQQFQQEEREFYQQLRNLKTAKGDRG